MIPEIRRLIEDVVEYFGHQRRSEWLTDDGYLGACDVINRAKALLAPSPAGQEEPPFDFLAHLQRQRDWSGQTFGPGPRTIGVIDHIRKELREIEADPSDISEWIDVVILALDGAWRAGYQPAQIIDALRLKQAKNEARQWPDWRTMSPDEAIEHVRLTPSGQPPAQEELDTTCDNDVGRTCKQLWPTDRPSWCWGCLNTLVEPAAQEEPPARGFCGRCDVPYTCQGVCARTLEHLTPEASRIAETVLRQALGLPASGHPPAQETPTLLEDVKALQAVPGAWKQQPDPLGTLDRIRNEESEVDDAQRIRRAGHGEDIGGGGAPDGCAADRVREDHASHQCLEGRSRDAGNQVGHPPAEEQADPQEDDLSRVDHSRRSIRRELPRKPQPGGSR